MGIIIPFALRPSNAARFEAVGGEAHRAKMLIFPQVQVRDIRDIWGMTVEGPPHAGPDGVAFSDGKPRRAKASRAKSAGAKLPDSKSESVKRKPARRSPE
jgi:hypothetical protein